MELPPVEPLKINFIVSLAAMGPSPGLAVACPPTSRFPLLPEVAVTVFHIQYRIKNVCYED